MSWVEFEATIPAFERAKTVHALRRVLTTTLQFKGGYSQQRCNVQRNGCCNHIVLTAWLHVFTMNTAEQLVFGFMFGERTRHTWLQQPWRCTLQRCNEYPPLDRAVTVIGHTDNIWINKHSNIRVSHWKTNRVLYSNLKIRSNWMECRVVR
jgi:hypothetical protein